MKKISTLIVEDETLSRDLLVKLLGDLKDYEFELFFAKSVSAAISELGLNEIDLILLDVNLDGRSGFEILDSSFFQNTWCPVVFVTAHDEFAIKAFKYSAVDYLLKPVSSFDLENAIKRALKARISTRQKKFSVLNAQMSQEPMNQLVVPTNDTLEFIPIEAILFCQADGSYSEIHTTQACFVASKTLKAVQHLLADFGFYRVHSGYLVNLNQVSKYLRGKGGQVVLKSGHVVPVSTRRKEGFLRRIRNNGI